MASFRGAQAIAENPATRVREEDVEERRVSTAHFTSINPDDVDLEFDPELEDDVY